MRHGVKAELYLIEAAAMRRMRIWSALLTVGLASVDPDEHVHGLFKLERNLSEAAEHLALGAEKGCGRCFFYLGAMLALGEPKTNVSARFKVLKDGNIEFRCLAGCVVG